MNKIFKLKPVYKDYLWGGSRLKKEFDKDTSLVPTAESWELSAYPNSESKVTDGQNQVVLSQFFKENPDFFGDNVNKNVAFPILIKIIDADDSLSVQVHPDDDYALKYENQSGKNEFWYILDAAKDSFIYLGVKEHLTKNELKETIRNNSLESYLNKIPVKAGQGYFIPAGTIHAIGKGCLILEIQQSSDVTYRLYDYNRTNNQGKKRELHLEKGVEVSSLIPLNDSPATDNPLIDNNYFRIREYDFTDNFKLPQSKDSFTYLFCAEGKFKVKVAEESLNLKKGESAIIAAGSGLMECLGNGSCIVVDVTQ